MLFFKIKPTVELKLAHPKLIFGRQLTWVNVYIRGKCKVVISSKSHPQWKSVKIKSPAVNPVMIAVPIGAQLVIKTSTLFSSSKTYFDVAKADWKLTPPNMPKMALKPIEAAKQILLEWREFVYKLNRTRSNKALRNIRKVSMKPRFINMRVSKAKFSNEALTNEPSVH